MALIRFEERPFFRNPWLEFERMRRDIESMMRGFEYGATGAPAATAVFPAMNLTEDNDNVYVNAEVPGIAPDDLDISVEGNTLIIKGERTTTPDQKVSYHRREIEQGKFSRAVTLPTKVEPAKVEAKTIDGILYITLPKSEEVKPKQIKVEVE
ncbi:MAG: Hsp20/alpha crystallin family protein [Desulfobacteraceae bacterium]|nr:Hsp20/alpha crystallin family protein [Desulfobacteraceae bacterium]